MSSIATPILWIGLNPSTAADRRPDGSWANDNTITKEMGYLARWCPGEHLLPAIGYEGDDLYIRFSLVRPGLAKVNLFPFRSTKPRGLLDAADASERLGSAQRWRASLARNDDTILEAASTAGTIICAWGGPYGPRRLHELVTVRARAVCGLLVRAGHVLHVLALSQDGIPRHPLMLPYSLVPMPWSPTG